MFSKQLSRNPLLPTVYPPRKSSNPTVFDRCLTLFIYIALHLLLEGLLVSIILTTIITIGK